MRCPSCGTDNPDRAKFYVECGVALTRRYPGEFTPGYRILSLSLKYNSVLFPFEAVQFLKALSKQGYLLTDPIGPMPLGMRAEVSGIVGRKGDVAVRLDMPRQILGVSAPDAKSAVAEMDALESLVKAEFGFESSHLAQYYALLAGLTIRAKKNPIASWQAYAAQLPLIEKASQALGMKVSLFGIHLTPQGQVPNQADWCDIRIEPFTPSASDHHSVEVIFRRARRDEVFTFTRRLDDIISDLVSLVEQG